MALGVHVFIIVAKMTLFCVTEHLKLVVCAYCDPFVICYLFFIKDAVETKKNGNIKICQEEHNRVTEKPITV